MDKTTKLITFLYKQKFDEDVISVTSITGELPSQENSFLFNPFFNQFQGQVKTESGSRYVFFLSKEGEKWKLDSREV